MKGDYEGIEFWTPLGGIFLGQGYTRLADGDYFEGVAIETPLGGIRLGQGEQEMEVSERERAELYREAHRRARRWLGFLRHLTTFVWVNLVILVADILIDRDEFFVQWVAAIWGAILVVQFLRAFVISELLGSRAERRFTEWQVRRMEGRAGKRE